MNKKNGKNEKAKILQVFICKQKKKHANDASKVILHTWPQQCLYKMHITTRKR